MSTPTKAPKTNAKITPAKAPAKAPAAKAKKTAAPAAPAAAAADPATDRVISALVGDTVTLYARRRDGNILKAPEYVTVTIPKTLDDLPFETYLEVQDVLSKHTSGDRNGLGTGSGNYLLGVEIGIVVARALDLTIDLKDPRLTTRERRELAATLWLFGLRMVTSGVDPNAAGG